MGQHLRQGWDHLSPCVELVQSSLAVLLPLTREHSSAHSPWLGKFSEGSAKFFTAGGCFCIYHRHLLVGCDLIFRRGLPGMCLRNRVWGRMGKDVVACLIRKAIMKSGWRRGESSGSFLINPGSCWASSPSGMFRDAVCLNSLHLLMQ